MEEKYLLRVEVDQAAAVKQAAELGQEIDRLTKGQKELKKHSVVWTENAALIRNLKAEQKEYTKTIDQSVNSFAAQDGSMNQLKANLALLTQQYNGMSREQRENTDTGQALQARIKGISDELKGQESAIGDTRRNVGNYSQAMKVLEQSLAEVNQKISANTAAGKGNDDATKSLIKEQELLSQLMQRQETGFAAASQELKENTKALQKMAAAGLEGTESYKQLLQATGNLKDDISDLKTKLTNVGSDTATFDGLIGAAQGLAGGFAVAEGAATIFGGSNEELQKQMVKLQAIMTVLNGLEAIKTSMLKQSSAAILFNTIATKAKNVAAMLTKFVMGEATVATVSNTAATGTQTAVMTGSSIAMGVATVAARVLKIALISTGIGAIVVLLGMFIGAAMDASDSTEEQAKKTKELKEENDKLHAAQLKTIESTEELTRAKTGGVNDMKRELDLMKSQGKTKEEIHTKERAMLIDELKVIYNSYLEKKRLGLLEIKDIEELKNATAAVKLSDAAFNTETNEKNIEASKKYTEKKKKHLEDLAKFQEGHNSFTTDLQKRALDSLDDSLSKDLAMQALKSKTETDSSNAKFKGLLASSTLNAKELADLTATHSKDMIALTDTQGKEVAAINSKWAKIDKDKKKEQADAFKTLTETEFQASIKFTGDFYDNLLTLEATKLANKEITKAEYDQRQKDIEIMKLKTLKQVNIDYGKETIDLDKQIAELRIATNQETADRTLAIDKQKSDRQLQLIKDIAASADSLIQASYDQQGFNFKKFKKAFILSLLDMLQKILQVKIAEVTITSLTTPQSIASGGLIGAAQAAVLSGLMSIAFSIAKAEISKAAGGGTFETKGPHLMLVGDNPGGRERVTVEPLSGRGQTYVAPGLIRAAGGATIMASGDGGYASRSASSGLGLQIAMEQTKQLLASMPAPVLQITELNRVQGRATEASELATLG